MHDASRNPVEMRRSFNRSPLASRAYLVGATILYSVLYTEMYRVMADFWEYLGFTVFGYQQNWQYVGYAVIAAIAPFIRIDRKTTGEFIANLVFYIVYIPSILTPLLQGRVSFLTAATSAGLLGLSFVFVTWVVHLAPRNARTIKPILSGNQFLGLIAVIWTAANLYVMIAFRDQLHFATIGEVYDQRFAFEAGGALVLYIILNAIGAVNPLILALGLRRKSAIMVSMGVASQVLMYSTLALKAVLASTLFSIIAHLLLMDRRGPKQALIPAGLAIVTAAGLILSPLYDGDSGFLGRVMSIVFMRTLETPGMLYGIYLEFFSVYPGTSYSHVSIVKPFVHYPYGSLQIGQVIGYYANPEAGYYTYNVNANYLAADGLTAFGLWGILAITIISGLIFRLVEGILRDTDKRLACVSIITSLFYLTNVSIFTTSLTYGGGLVVALLWLAARSSLELDRPNWRLF